MHTSRLERSRANDGRRAPDAGFTLIEVVVAVALFAVLISGTAAMVTGGLDLARNNRNRTIAANLASQEIDSLRSADFDDLVAAAGQTSEQVEVEGVPYDVTRDITWVDQDSTQGACDLSATSGLDPRLLRIVVRVSWNAMGSIPPVETETVLSPPVGSFDPTKGNIAVRVLDRDAGPGHGHPVTVTGPDDPPVQVTIDDNGEVGCAFFASLTPGSYTVALGTNGYVDRQGEATPAQSVSVNVGTVSSVQFDYDRAATVDVTLSAPGAGSVPTDVPLTLGNSAFLPLGAKPLPGSGVNRTIGDLFPFADGFQVWAGDCADADPEGEDLVGGGAYWPGALRPPVVAVEPGQSAAATVELPTVDVTVTSGGSPVSTVTVRALHAPDTGCEAGATFVLGTTDATGRVLGAVPYGNYTLDVEGFSITPAEDATLTVDPNGSSPLVVSLAVAP